MIIIIRESEPQFCCTEHLLLVTKHGEVYIEKGSPVGLLRVNDEKIHLGKSGHVLEFDNINTITEFLKHCSPATFELGVDAEGDEVIKPIIENENATLGDKISRIEIREDVPNFIIKVEKIKISK